MGPQDTYVVKMDHLVTRTRVRGELAPSPLSHGLESKPLGHWLSMA